MGFSLCAVQACSDDEEDEVIDDPSKNTTDIAVTGAVEEYGCLYAYITGYVNLNLLPAGSGNPEIGIEVCAEDSEDDYYNPRTAGSLNGNVFTLSFSGFSPATKYKYRSFVKYGGLTHYGEYRTFTTRPTYNVTSTGDISDVTYNKAKITTHVQISSSYPEDYVEVGVAYATSKDAIHPDSTCYKRYIYDVEDDGEYVITISDLSINTTYYYASFTTFDYEVYTFSNVKSFTTNGLSNLTTTGEASDIATSIATVTSNVATDAIDDNLNVGIAYSTSETALHPDGSFNTEVFSKEDIVAGICKVTLKGLSPGTTYYYASFVELDGEYCFAEIKSFTTKDFVLAQSGAIDLGLSVKWAAYNVGASKPEEYGDYYAWGETEEKSDYYWDTYKWCKGTDDTMTKYCTSSGYGTVDNKTVLDPEDDVAHVKWGDTWRMPTRDEIEELVNNCTWEWTAYNGVNGQLVTGPNGNSIFLPAAGCRFCTDLINRGSRGYYWSATLYEYYSGSAYYLHFHDGNYWNSWNGRSDGVAVRPVTE